MSFFYDKYSDKIALIRSPKNWITFYYYWRVISDLLTYIQMRMGGWLDLLGPYLRKHFILRGASVRRWATEAAIRNKI